MREDREIARRAFGLGDDGVLARQIGHGQARDGGEGLRAVGGLLAGAQGLGPGHEFLVVVVGERVVDAAQRFLRGARRGRDRA